MASVALINGWTGRRDRLVESLHARGHAVRRFDALAAETLVRRWRPDVVVVSGVAVQTADDELKLLRAGTDAAIAVVLPEAGFLDVVDLYDAGADDCVAGAGGAGGADLLTDTVAALLRPVDGAVPRGVDLLPIERRILAVLYRDAVTQPITMPALQCAVWGPGRTGEAPVLRLYLSTLRRKLATVDGLPGIVSVLGGQYRLAGGVQPDGSAMNR